MMKSIVAKIANNNVDPGLTHANYFVFIFVFVFALFTPCPPPLDYVDPDTCGIIRSVGMVGQG